LLKDGKVERSETAFLQMFRRSGLEAVANLREVRE
jgi:hypothetical protein